MPLIQRLQSKLNPNLVRLLAYLKPHKGKLLMSVFFMIGAGAGSSLIALLLGKLTDVGFYDQEEWIVLGAPAALIFIAFLHGGSMFMSNYLLGKTTQSVLVQLRGEIFRKLLRWPAATYQGYPTGAVTSKFIYESNVALSSAAKSSIILVRDTCQVVALVCVLLWNNWMLALVSLLLAPLIVKLLRFISSRVKVLMKHCQESFAEVLGRIKQVYDGHRLVKLSDTYEYELGRFHSINDTMRRMLLEMTKVSSLGTPLTQVICMSGVAVVLAFAMYQTIGVVAGIAHQAQRTAEVLGHPQTAYPVVMVDGFLAEGQHAHGDAAYLEMSAGNELLLRGIDIDHLTFFRFTFHTGNGAGENPRMETLERFFLSGFEKYFLIAHLYGLSY